MKRVIVLLAILAIIFAFGQATASDKPPGQTANPHPADKPPGQTGNPHPADKAPGQTANPHPADKPPGQ